MKPFAILILLCTILSSASLCSENSVKFQNIYKAEANADSDITIAIQNARADDKRVLLVFGANWCPWCQRLHHLFETNVSLKKYLKKHFVVVLIDLGKRDRNMDIDTRYGHPSKLGLPVLIVLEQNGQLLHTQETGSLEFPKDNSQKGHDPDKVLQFFKTWTIKATP
jgi:thiol-disulfide isomerase/thioredoxin